MIKKYIFSIVILLFSFQFAQSQVLISLLLGDKLNSDKIKFGLEGGVNFANVTNLETATFEPNFNIGFYFDFKLKDSPNWFLHTGVIVKSTMGASLDPYSLNDENLDAIFEGGSVERKLQYWNVPFLARYKFDNNIFIEAGPMFGLLYKGVDIFTNEVDGNDVQYDNNIRKEHSRFDIGLEGGVGYHLEKVMNGMNIGARYYYGLLNSSTTANANQKNVSYYVFVGLPIGAGEKAKAKNEAAKEAKEAQFKLDEENAAKGLETSKGYQREVKKAKKKAEKEAKKEAKKN
jgi:hypothetical protein